MVSAIWVGMLNATIAITADTNAWNKKERGLQSEINAFAAAVTAIDAEMGYAFRQVCRHSGALEACDTLVRALYELPATAWWWDEEQVVSTMAAANDLADALV